MSLNQLTANYTDSEGEDEEMKQVNSDSFSSDDRNSTSTPPRKVLGRLVSYANDEDDQGNETINDIQEESMNSEPMDTGTDDGEEEKIESVDYGIKLPSAPLAQCSAQLQEKITRFLKKVKDENIDYNKYIQNNKEFRNPSIYEKLISHIGLDEQGSNYPLELFDPHCWGKESFYDELAKVQTSEMEKREKERKEKAKSEVSKKPAEEEIKKRKSRFDQGAPSGAKSTMQPPNLTAVPSGTKPTINAFGALKKSK